jgi:uncharacterized integral membrane protein
MQFKCVTTYHGDSIVKSLSNLIISGILAVLVSAIAIISVQNATLVSLRLFGLRSINLPFGVVLALTVAVGIITGAILPFLWRWLGTSEIDDDDYFEEDF